MVDDGYLVWFYVVVPWEIGSVRGCEKVMAVSVCGQPETVTVKKVEMRGYQEKTGGALMSWWLQ
jgi:hypothetical protein